jgi:hypothetical protein
MSKAREPVKNQSFCNWFLFFHIFLRDVVMYKTQSSLSFFLSLVQASKQANKQTNSRTCYCHLEEELQGEASLLCGISKLHHDGGSTSVSCAVSMTPLKAKSHTSGSGAHGGRNLLGRGGGGGFCLPVLPYIYIFVLGGCALVGVNLFALLFLVF